MAGLIVEFSERWHFRPKFRVLPSVHENVFALEREPNLGSPMVARVQSDDWNSTMPWQLYLALLPATCRVVVTVADKGAARVQLCYGSAPGQVGRDAVSPIEVHNGYRGLVAGAGEEEPYHWQAIRLAD